jgi:hypothetical protein
MEADNYTIIRHERLQGMLAIFRHDQAASILEAAHLALSGMITMRELTRKLEMVTGTKIRQDLEDQVELEL